MNKKLVSGCILSICILILTSFTPSISARNLNETNHELSTIFNENQNSGNYIEEYIVDDCGCNQNNAWEFPLICSVLKVLFELVLIFSPFPVPLLCWVIIYIAEILGCPNIP